MKLWDFICKHIQEMVVIGGIIFAYLSFQLELKDIPLDIERLKIQHQTDVSNINTKIITLDTRVDNVEKTLAENNTKTDLLLKAVYDLRADIKDYYRK